MEKDRRGDLWDFADKASTFVLANLFWVVLSLPVITLPLATAGLFAVMSLWARGRPTEVFRDFFPAMRQHWKKAYVVVVGDILVGGLVVLNLNIFPLMDMSQPLALMAQGMTLFVGLMGLMVNLYIWPMMVTVDLPLRNLVLMSAKLVFAHPLWSFAMLILALLLVVVSAFLPAAFLLTVTFSCFALLANWGAWRIIRRYLPEDERREMEGMLPPEA